MRQTCFSQSRCVSLGAGFLAVTATTAASIDWLADIPRLLFISAFCYTCFWN